MSKEDSNGEGKSQDTSMPDTPTKDGNADIYENRGSKKIIRVVTVMAYLFSVSFVGILLSAYYIFLWEPPNPRLMQHQRLRTDPQTQFLIAPLSDETDLTKKDSSVLQSAVNRVHKPLLGRMTQNTFDDSVVHSRGKINPEKLNLILKLRNSLVNAQRAQNRNMSQEIAISSGFNNSLGGVEKGLNLTMDRAKNTISRHGESRGNISEKKTYSDNADLPPEFAGSASTTLDVESTSFTTIPGTETSQIHLHKDSVTSVNPIVEEKNHKKKLDAVELYLVHRFSNATTNNDVTNGSNQRVFKDNNSFKMIQEFLKTDKKESKTNHRLINNDRENDPGDVQTSVILEERVNGSVRNSQKNYSNDNKSFSKNQTGQITRDTVSTDSSSNNLGFTGDPGFYQTPDEPTVIKSRLRITETRNSEETQIERMTARSTTIDNKELEQIDLSTTQRQKSLSEIFTEIMDETSAELTSISTTRDYHNFTSITSEDDESVT